MKQVLFAVISSTLLINLPVYALPKGPMTPINNGRNIPQLAETTVSGKVYLPAAPALTASSDCSRITVELWKLGKPVASSSTSLQVPTHRTIAKTVASGDIKRGYCDYSLKFNGASDNYYLGANAPYNSLWQTPAPSSVVDSEPRGWTNPINTFDGSRDMTLKATVIR